MKIEKNKLFNIPNKLKSYNLQANKGFSLVEAILASAIFVLLVTALVGAYLYGQEATALAGNRTRAVLLAEEGLEASRNIRDAGFFNLIDGAYGLATTSNQWNFSGSQDITDIFTRQIVISSVDAKRKLVTANVTWQQNPQRTGAVSLATYLTNWQDTGGIPVCNDQANNLTIDSSGASLGAGNKELQGIMVSNTNSSCDIVFDKVTVAWTNVARNIERVRIGNSAVWTGSATTGAELDVTDTTLANSDGQVETKYRFSGSMSGDIFSITFTMSDGATKTVSGVSP